MLIRAGWLDAAFAAGALRRFATFSNHQEVEIGPWGHGGGSFADTLRPDGTLDGNLLSPEGQDGGWWSSSLDTSGAVKHPMAGIA